MTNHPESLMERRLIAQGFGRRKPEKQPETLVEGLAEIAYLKAVETMARRRAAILYRLYSLTVDHAAVLEAQRLKFERLYIPITHVKPFEYKPVQKVTPKTKEEVLALWKGMTDEQIDKLVKQLESLKED